MCYVSGGEENYKQVPAEPMPVLMKVAIVVFIFTVIGLVWSIYATHYPSYVPISQIAFDDRVVIIERTPTMLIVSVSVDGLPIDPSDNNEVQVRLETAALKRLDEEAGGKITSHFVSYVTDVYEIRASKGRRAATVVGPVKTVTASAVLKP